MADAGCILEVLSEHIAPHKHIMPLDLGAKGRCVITVTPFEDGRILTSETVVRLVGMWRRMREG